MVLVLVMGATLGNFCGASASHGCHSLWANFVVLVMSATLGNFCGASASHGC